MSDLTRKLREDANRRKARWKYALVECDDVLAAATEIERLENRLAEEHSFVNILHGEVERHKTRMARVVELEQEVERLRGLQVE